MKAVPCAVLLTAMTAALAGETPINADGSGGTTYVSAIFAANDARTAG